MSKVSPALLFPMFLLLLTSCGKTEFAKNAPDGPSEIVEQNRSSGWAEPISDKVGLSNFYKVSDALYRGAQPEPKGFAELKKMGIKTVINLRSLHSDRDECEAVNLDYVPIRAQAWEGENDEVVDFLKVVLDPKKQPVFVHCQHGADRTGTMCAIYRIVEQGWTKEDAIKEMTTGGFGFHRIWQNLPIYIEQLDMASIMSEVE